MHSMSVGNLELASQIREKIGTELKNQPLRQAYVAEVEGLAKEAQEMLAGGSTKQATAEAMWTRRREIGVKYKDMTPAPLRDFIYAVNQERYGDQLGPSFERLVQSAEKKNQDPYQKIIASSARSNDDVDKLLSHFGDWLGKKDAAYLDNAREILEK